MISRYATCRECSRTFDLCNDHDADEWAYGHDCEPPLTITQVLEAHGIAYRTDAHGVHLIFQHDNPGMK